MKGYDTIIEEPGKVDYRNIYYPPGGILIWILIVLELLTFGIALIALVVHSKLEKELFFEMSGKLNSFFGTINTFVLLTSGFFIASSIHRFKEKNINASKNYLLLAILSGCLFIAIKSVEYKHLIKGGFVLGSNTFMNFYWLLTGFHLIHVLVGLVILMIFYIGLHKKPANVDILDFEAGTSFWHLCDLIWLMIFPLLYLMFQFSN